MTDVKNSTLYKTLKKAVRKQDHAELLRMLKLVPESAKADQFWDGFKTTRLYLAFSWADTPQGWEYWSGLSEKLRRAGHECG